MALTKQPAQMGWSYYLVADSWLDVGTTAPIAAVSSVIGISFEFSLGLATTYNIPATISAPTSLTLIPQTAVSGTFVQSIWGVPEVAPERYSTTNTAGGRSEMASANLICTANLESGDQTADQPFTFEFGKIYTSGSGWAEDSTLSSNLLTLNNEYYQSASWNGRICFTSLITSAPLSNIPIYYTQLETTTTYHPSLSIVHGSTYYADTSTGHAINGVGHRARAIHCGRSGLPAMSDQLVEDSWTEGLYVLADWAEPEDRTEILTNVSDSEGTTDDIPGF